MDEASRFRSRAPRTFALAPYVPFVLVCAAAVIRSETTKGPPSLVAADAPLLRAAFSKLAAEEPRMRHEASKDFPTDPWSADDAFHSLEQQRWRAYARERRLRIIDVLAAMDDGLRESWPSATLEPLGTTVPPCRPRAIY